VATSADPFNLLSDINDVQLVGTLLCYSFEFCTSALTAQTPKEGNDKFSNKLKPSAVALAHILCVLKVTICSYTWRIFFRLYAIFAMF
jgi:hypothetical protein